MDRQGKEDIIDLSVPTSWSSSLMNKGSVINGSGMTIEELQIRHELEIDIERDLEEEIKDGIYHLALRLLRLYQHKMERTARDQESEHRAKFAKEEKKKKMVSEININIKIEGGTKVEIKESKKESPPEKSRPRSCRPENMQSSNNKKFDWVNTLRTSGTSTSAGQLRNPNYHENAKRNIGHHGSKQHKGNSNTDKDLLELGWKY